MDIGIVVAIVMLVVWGVATFAFEAPGLVHVLLTVGVFLLIYRVVVRGTPKTPTDGAPRDGTRRPR